MEMANNKFAGKCAECGVTVPAGAGFLVPPSEMGLTFRALHPACAESFEKKKAARWAAQQADRALRAERIAIVQRSRALSDMTRRVPSRSPEMAKISEELATLRRALVQFDLAHPGYEKCC
jgi:hypothetical protein